MPLALSYAKSETHENKKNTFHRIRKLVSTPDISSLARYFMSYVGNVLTTSEKNSELCCLEKQLTKETKIQFAILEFLADFSSTVM